MEFLWKTLMRIHVIRTFFALLLVALLSSEGVESRKAKVVTTSLEYNAINCRAHSASLTDFGGVGDGKASNTKAFQSAISHLSQYASEGGSQLYVPAGKWLTGSFSLTSHFTLYLDKDAVLLASQDITEWPVLEPLPSYGRGRDAPAGRFTSLIFGTNLTDVIVTGENGTIDGQGEFWWQQFHRKKLKYTRPYLIELMFSDNIQISNLTLLNSPSWNVHPVYSRIEDCYIVSGDDCVAVKSGWDEYGIKFGWPTKQLMIRRLTCISPYSATIALGSEMSGGIQDVRAEDITAIQTESGVRIKTAVGRGGYVKDIYVKRMTLHTMKWAFKMTGDYNSHADSHYDPNALPEIKNINYRDVVAENVTIAARFQGISNDPFTGICIANVTLRMAAKAKKQPWTCTDIEGMTSGVTPPPCGLLPDQGPEKITACDFPADSLPIDMLELKKCTTTMTFVGV
ncbi:putative polygalacturonase [Glycine max]|nr:putative polygalacturonase [Glycine max]